MSSDTKSRILEAAWRLLETGGAAEIRMSDIAKDVGISRQALYLHYKTRAELLIAVTRYIDEVKDVDALLQASRSAVSGEERLDAFIEAWGGYIPQIYGVAKALLVMEAEDEAARLAWEDRMAAVRHGCEAAVKALQKDGKLRGGLNKKQAIDLLWTLLSVRNWEQLRHDCGWSQKLYEREIKHLARAALIG